MPDLGKSRPTDLAPSSSGPVFVFGAVFVVVWGLGEGLHNTPPAGGVGWAFFNAAVLAPFAIMVGLLAAAMHRGWRWCLTQPHPIRGGVRGVRRWWTAPGAQAPAWLAGGILVVLMAGMGALIVGVEMATRIRTPGYLVLSLVLLSVAALAVAALALPVCAWGFVVLFGAITKRFPGGFVKVWRLRVMIALVVLGGTLVTIFTRKRWAQISILPWWMVVTLLVGFGAAWGAAAWALKRPRRAARLCFMLLTAVSLVAAFLPRNFAAARGVFAGQSTVAGLWMSRVESLLDFDGDGSISFYASGDCAPFNPNIGPARADIPNNGIDEDCSGSDAHETVAVLGETPLLFPMPATLNRRPHIFLITTDSLEARHTSLGGYSRDVTPRLAGWAKRATVFTSAFSLAAATRTAFPGLVAGMFNSQVPMKRGGSHPFVYADDVVTMAVLLKRAGYRTVHIPGHPYFLKGGRGFHTNGFDEVLRDGIGHPGNEHTAPLVTRSALNLIRAQAPQQPLFLWIHYYDHHSPFTLPAGEPSLGDQPVDLYDAELRFADRHWGEVLDEIEKRFAPGQAITVFTADHGEAFDANHPRERHAGSILSSVLHVPLIIQTAAARGAVFKDVISHADLIVTLANVVGGPPVPGWVGSSLVGLLGGTPLQREWIFSLRYAPEAVLRKQDGFADIGIRSTDFYLMRNVKANTTRLVKWREDPLERTDVSADFPETFERMNQALLDALNWLRANEKALKLP